VQPWLRRHYKQTRKAPLLIRKRGDSKARAMTHLQRRGAKGWDGVAGGEGMRLVPKSADEKQAQMFENRRSGQSQISAAAVHTLAASSSLPGLQKPQSMMPVLGVRESKVTHPTGDPKFSVMQAFPAGFSAEEADPFLMCDEVRFRSARITHVV
jgi:hypothetical protein